MLAGVAGMTGLVAAWFLAGQLRSPAAKLEQKAQ